MKPREAAPPKKPYQTPKLFIYGDLTTMTQASGRRGMADGGMTGFNRRTA
jgi:hypothetical protein